MLTLQLLGSPQMLVNQKKVNFDTRKAMAILAVLAISREARSRDSLAVFLWEELDQTRARAALRRTLSALQAAVGKTSPLSIDRETVSLRVDKNFAVDVFEFESLVAQVQRHSHPDPAACKTCTGWLIKAAELYRGDFLQGFTLRDSVAFDDWQYLESDRLRRQFAGVLEQLVACYTAQHQPQKAIAVARRWLQLDPLHETAHSLLMQLYAQSGQRALALRQYQECARVLERELSVQPLEATTRLMQAIKENRVAPVPTPTARDADSVQPARPALRPLVGRAAEQARLQAIYTAASEGGQVVAIEGEAGIGKTRLADALLRYAQAQGGVVFSARCYFGQAHLAYGSIAECLRAQLAQPGWQARLASVPHFQLAEAARLLPDLSSLLKSESPVPQTAASQSLFYDALRLVTCALAQGSAAAVLFVDDAQWLDEASLDWLIYFARRLGNTPLLLVMAWRAEDVPGDHRLQFLLSELQRAQKSHVIKLSRLTLDDVKQMAQPLLEKLGTADSQALATRLYAETEGSPLFVVEYLAALEHAPTDEASWTMPAGIRNILSSRLSAVSETARQSLAAAAVIGRSFDVEILQEASGRTEDEIANALEELTSKGLAVEVSALTAVYDFSHDKVRSLVYDQTGLARRRLLHRRAADALVNRARREPTGDALASQIARHYHLAGIEAQAADYFKRAGDYARAIFANTEALSHYRSALALHPSNASMLYEAIGDMLTLTGDYRAALASYESAAATATPESLVRLEHRLANVYDRWGEWQLAEIHLKAALDLSETNDRSKAQRANLYADWSKVALHRGEAGAAAELAAEALQLAQQAGDARALAKAFNINGIIASHHAQFSEAMRHLQQSLSLAVALGDPEARIAALNNLALTYYEVEDFRQALAHVEEALQLCASIGDRHRQAALHNNMADVLHRQGRNDEAMRHLKQATALFADISGELPEGAPAWQPEIWKLTEW